MSRKITRCGFTSITYGSKWILWEHSYPISTGECDAAVSTGQLIIDGRAHEVKPGQELNTRFFSQGGVDDYGGCTTADIKATDGTTYSGFFEETILRIKIERIPGQVHVSTGKVVFANGAVAHAKEEFARDPAFGTMIWRDVRPPCKETVMTVYVGQVSLHHRKKTTTGVQGTILMLDNEETQQSTALVLMQDTWICDRTCSTTSIQGIIVCRLGHDQDPVTAKIVPTSDPITKDLHARMESVNIRKSLSSNARFAKIQQDICNTERKTLATKLQNLAGTQNPYALLDVDSFDGKGYSVFIAGATAYLTKCTPVEATLADFDTCTMEIPIKVSTDKDSKIRFADPFTFIVSDFPTELPCNSVNPVRWRISDKWLCATPAVHECSPPTQLKPATTPFQPDSREFTRTSGLFTDRQLADYKVFQRAQFAIRPLQQRMANSASSNGDDKGNLGLPFGQQQLDDIASGVAGQFLPFLARLGPTFAKTLGILVIASWAAALCQFMLRLYFLLKHRGFGWWIIGAISSTTFQLLMTPVEIMRAAVNKVLHPNNDTLRIDLEAQHDFIEDDPIQTPLTHSQIASKYRVFDLTGTEPSSAPRQH
jgi:hypothetical protein